MSVESAIGWRGIAYGTPVWTADGLRVGHVREVLGSDAQDIFHGIRVDLGARQGSDTIVAADDITAMTTERITVSLTRDEVLGGPRYTDQATYHVGTVGTIRKHLGWKRDSGSDEEPG
jgi:hypothetical protein